MIGGQENPLAQGTINRDITGRQIVTVNEGTKFSFDIPLVDFNQLSQNATSAFNLMQAITTPVPDDVAAMGDAATDYYRRLIAAGKTPEQALADMDTPYIRRQITALTNLNAAEEFYGRNNQPVPEDVKRLILSGERIQFGPDGPMIEITGCTSGPDLCKVIFNKDTARSIADQARSNFIEAVNYALERGSTSDIVDSLKQNALLYAACNPEGWQSVQALLASLPAGLRSDVEQYLKDSANKTIDRFIAKGDLKDAADVARQVGHPSAGLMSWLSNGIIESAARGGIDMAKLVAERIAEDPAKAAETLKTMGLPTELAMRTMLGADEYSRFQKEIAEGGAEAAKALYNSYMALAREGELTPLQAQIMGAGAVMAVMASLSASGGKAAFKEIAESAFFKSMARTFTNAERVALAEFQGLRSDADRVLLLTFERGGRMRPGVASQAELPNITDGQAWLRGTEANAGRIPGQIAEKLQGREFANFNEFREAFWREVANDPVLSGQFDARSLNRMRNGYSPEAPPLQQVGGRRYYELDHTMPISEGGGVFDMNNIVIRTPLNHIRRHQ